MITIKGRIVTPEKIASDLAACKAAFDEARIPWVIIEGIVLGYARYKAIMEWDTDLDVGVFVELTGKHWSRLYSALCKNGFIKLDSRQLDFQWGRREVTINMHLFHRNGNFYESFPRTTKGLKFVEKAKWYEEPQIVDFLGDKYPMPNHLEDYLACQYGKDWRTNIIKDHEEYFVDKRGSRDTSKWLSGRSSKHGDLWPKILKIDDTMEDVQ